MFNYKKPTPEALKLKHALEQLGLKVDAEYSDDGHKHVDLAIRASRMNIEVDGDRHLTDAYQIIRDLDRAKHSNNNVGFATIHIPNNELNENLGGIASALAEAAKIREERFRTHKNI